MLNESFVKPIFEKYGINIEKILKQNNNILIYGNYNEIENILNYLVNELKIKPSKIEKAPSIICFSDKTNIQNNYEYLIRKNISLKKISNSLTVLSTPHNLLVENFEYIEENLGKELIYESLSTLSIEHNLIVLIIEKFKKYNKEDILIKYPITISNIKDSKTIDEIEQILTMTFFQKNSDKITSSIFLRTKEELEKIINIPYFKNNPEKIKGTIFLRSAKEIEEIVNLEFFKKNPRKLTASVFHRTPDEINEILEMEYFKSNPQRLTPSVFSKNPTDIKQIIELNEISNNKKNMISTAVHKNKDEIIKIMNLSYFKANPDKLTSTVFQRTADEIGEILNLEFFKKYPEKLTPTVFLKTKEEIEEILNIPYYKENPEMVSGTLFHSSAKELKKLLKINYFINNPKALQGNVLKKKADDIKESIEYLNLIKENRNIDLCIPSIFMHKKKHIQEVIEFLDSIDERLIEILPKSNIILTLSIEEIKLRYKIIIDNNYPLVLNNGQFNSLFGMPRKRFEERYGVSFDELKEKLKKDKTKKLTITRI